MIQPLGNYLYAERLVVAPDSETIALPATAQEMTYDLLVQAVGPQATQARMGDRVIIQSDAWREWNEPVKMVNRGRVEYGQVAWGCPRCGAGVRTDQQKPPTCDQHHTGFTSDADLVAVIPGPDHDEIYPANDYVLIEPDTLYMQDEGAIVQKRESGILVASHTLIGGGDHAKQEGWQAYQESRRLWDSPEWQAEPEYYRHRRLHAYLDGLHPDVRRACRKFAETEQQPAERRGWVQREAPTRGRVVEIATEAWTSGSLMFDADTGVNWDVMPGDTVHWSGRHTALVLQVGDRQLLALKAGYLDAVEVE